MLTLLIATGCRPEAWAISEKLLARQTYEGPARLIIVDDGETPQPVTLARAGWEIHVLRRAPFWQPGQNTQARNLATGLAAIGRDERVVIFEDDDWYAPGYLADVAQWLDHYDLVGESHARYFNVATRRGMAMRNDKHASLCSSAAKGAGLIALRRAVTSRRTYIDLALWESRVSKRLFRTQHVVGIKGLPGRGGIGGGHKKQFGVPMNLRDLIGEDAALYGL